MPLGAIFGHAAGLDYFLQLMQSFSNIESRQLTTVWKLAWLQLCYVGLLRVVPHWLSF